MDFNVTLTEDMNGTVELQSGHEYFAVFYDLEKGVKKEVYSVVKFRVLPDGRHEGIDACARNVYRPPNERYHEYCLHKQVDAETEAAFNQFRACKGNGQGKTLKKYSLKHYCSVAKATSIVEKSEIETYSTSPHNHDAAINVFVECSDETLNTSHDGIANQAEDKQVCLKFEWYGPCIRFNHALPEPDKLITNIVLCNTNGKGKIAYGSNLDGLNLVSAEVADKDSLSADQVKTIEEYNSALKKSPMSIKFAPNRTS